MSGGWPPGPLADGPDGRDLAAGQLLYIAKERNYQPGWAAHKYKGKFGDWPARSWRYGAPMLPTAEIRACIKSRQIAYAKAIQAQRQ
jgi:DNA repair protein RadD